MSRLTRKQFEEAMHKEACSINQLVVKKYAYIDTVVIWFHARINKTQLAEIIRRCDGSAWPEYLPMKFQPWWSCKLTMQRPRDECFGYLAFLAFGFLDDVCRDYKINQLHIALDLCTEIQADAQAVNDFNATYLVKPWPGKRKLGNYGLTLYSAKPSKTQLRNNLVQYSDRPSKITGQPCMHLEWRCLNAGDVKRAGVQSFDDLINFQHRDFWEPKLRYQVIDLGALGQRLLKTKRRQPREKDFRTGHFIARLAAYRHVNEPTGEFIRPYGCVSAIREVVGAKLVNKCVLRLPNDGFLPK